MFHIYLITDTYPEFLDTRDIKGLKYGPILQKSQPIYYTQRGKDINKIIIKRFQIYIGNETTIECMESECHFVIALLCISEEGTLALVML